MLTLTPKIHDFKMYKIIDKELDIYYYLKIDADVVIKLCYSYLDSTLRRANHIAGIVYTGFGAQLILEVIKQQGYETNILDILVTTGLTESDIQASFEETYSDWQKSFYSEIQPR